MSASEKGKEGRLANGKAGLMTLSSELKHDWYQRILPEALTDVSG